MPRNAATYPPIDTPSARSARISQPASASARRFVSFANPEALPIIRTTPAASSSPTTIELTSRRRLATTRPSPSRDPA